MRLKVGLCQMTSTGDMAANLARAEALVREAAAEGCGLIATPEVTNLIAPNAKALFRDARPEAEDPTLARLREIAQEAGVWVLIGSLTLRTDSDRAANRSFLIDPEGRITAQYDKIHMFRADLPNGETYDEARSYRPGDRAVLADFPWGSVGMTICYDLRFPALYRALAQAGARILTIPAAFTVPTGEAHWHVLLRARAIETGCFVLAPAQWGIHGEGRDGGLRGSYGHSLIIDPWGVVLADGGEGEKVVIAEIDLSRVDKARAAVPSLSGDQAYAQPSSG